MTIINAPISNLGIFCKKVFSCMAGQNVFSSLASSISFFTSLSGGLAIFVSLVVFFIPLFSFC